MKRWLYSCRVEPPLYSVDVPQGRCTDVSISAFFSTTLHHVEPEGLRFHVKPDAVWVRHRPGGTRVPHGRRGMPLSEQGRGLGHSDLPRYPTITICVGIALGRRSIETHWILSVSRETYV